MSDSEGPPHYDTVVVGLGAAGVTAAATLANAGRRVLAVEAQPRVGGRVHTVALGEGVVELGAEWIVGTNNSLVFDVATQHNITVVPQDPTMVSYRSDGAPVDSRLVDQLLLQLKEEGPSTPEAQGNYTTRNLVFDVATQHNITVVPQDPTMVSYRSDGAPVDSRLVDQLLLQLKKEGPSTPEAQGNYTTRKIMEEITKNHPHVLKDEDFISGLLQFLNLYVNYLEGSSDWNDVTTGGDYEDLAGHRSVSWARHGYNTFFDIMLNTYNGGPGLPNLDIKLNKEARVIRAPRSPTERVTVDCSDGSSYVADTVIVTVSLGVLKDKAPRSPTERVTVDCSDGSSYVADTVIVTVSLGVLKDKAPRSPTERVTVDCSDGSSYVADTVIVTVSLGVLKDKAPRSPTERVTVDCSDGSSYVADTVIVTVSLGVLKDKAPRSPTERVTVDCSDGSSYVADTVIVTVSLGVLKDKYSSLFSPPLPEDKLTAIEKITMGVLDKIVLQFDQVWWPLNVNRFGFIWKAGDRKKVPVSEHWVTKIIGAHRPLGSNNVLILWTSGDIAKEVETLPEEQVKRKCVELLQRFMGDTLNVTVPQPAAIIRSTWYSNPYTRGSYSFDNTLTPQYPDARDWLARPLADSSGAPRVLFAGEAASRRHFGTVHGASETGHREAMRLVNKSYKN
ncbi:uncharacterized protein LOC134659947 [Cydia amplana]|uniref:uncharacterized protein LOC134659947 n=1 Tax=Cydia amplana TaxID=1869771 RepID=UPI002FE5550C